MTPELSRTLAVLVNWMYDAHHEQVDALRDWVAANDSATLSEGDLPQWIVGLIAEGEANRMNTDNAYPAIFDKFVRGRNIDEDDGSWTPEDWSAWWVVYETWQAGSTR